MIDASDAFRALTLALLLLLPTMATSETARAQEQEPRDDAEAHPIVHIGLGVWHERHYAADPPSADALFIYDDGQPVAFEAGAGVRWDPTRWLSLRLLGAAQWVPDSLSTCSYFPYDGGGFDGTCEVGALGLHAQGVARISTTHAYFEAGGLLGVLGFWGSAVDRPFRERDDGSRIPAPADGISDIEPSIRGLLGLGLVLGPEGRAELGMRLGLASDANDRLVTTEVVGSWTL